MLGATIVRPLPSPHGAEAPQHIPSETQLLLKGEDDWNRSGVLPKTESSSYVLFPANVPNRSMPEYLDNVRTLALEHASYVCM